MMFLWPGCGMPGDHHTCEQNQGGGGQTGEAEFHDDFEFEVAGSAKRGGDIPFLVDSSSGVTNRAEKNSAVPDDRHGFGFHGDSLLADVLDDRETRRTVAEEEGTEGAADFDVGQGGVHAEGDG